MYGIFVNQDGCIPYAEAIVQGYKSIETRNKNTLSPLVGKRVAVIKTQRGTSPAVVGYVDVTRSEFCPLDSFDAYRDKTLVPPGSRYDAHGRGKWLYYLSNAAKCDAYPLPPNAVRHGRSWCEF